MLFRILYLVVALWQGGNHIDFSLLQQILLCPTAKLWQNINKTTTNRSAVEARFQVCPDHLLQGHFQQHCPHKWCILNNVCSFPSFPLSGYFGAILFQTSFISVNTIY